MSLELSPTRRNEGRGRDECETSAQKKVMRSHRQSQWWVWVQLDHHGEEWERPSHYRVVSCRLMTGRNGLVTKCIVDQL